MSQTDGIEAEAPAPPDVSGRAHSTATSRTWPPAGPGERPPVASLQGPSDVAFALNVHLKANSRLLPREEMPPPLAQGLSCGPASSPALTPGSTPLTAAVGPPGQTARVEGLRLAPGLSSGSLDLCPPVRPEHRGPASEEALRP